MYISYYCYIYIYVCVSMLANLRLCPTQEISLRSAMESKLNELGKFYLQGLSDEVIWLRDPEGKNFPNSFSFVSMADRELISCIGYNLMLAKRQGLETDAYHLSHGLYIHTRWLRVAVPA